MRYLSLFILISFFYSCTKDKVQPTIESKDSISPISSTLLPLLFDTSSYWIYSNGSLSDTVSLTSIKREEAPLIPKQSNFETFLLNFESTLFNTYSERFMGAIITRNWIEEGWVYASHLGFGQSYGGLTSIEKLDTLIVGSQVFYNVSKFKVQQGSYFTDDMYLFYCDSVGIIRREILSGSVVVESWNLMEYNIVMYPY